MTIGDKIRHLRKEKKLTQKSLSVMTGIAEITIRNYEANKYSPKLEQLQKLAVALGVSLDELAGLDSDQMTTITEQSQKRRVFFTKYGIDEKSWAKVISNHMKFLDIVAEMGMNEEEFIAAYKEYNEMERQFIGERVNTGIITSYINKDGDPDAKKD